MRLTAVLVLHIVLMAAPAFSQNSPIHDNSAASNQGPFGFQWGMSKEQVIQLLGRAAVVDKPGNEDEMVVTTAPNPSPAFEHYMLLISPEQGLLKVVAISKDIRTDRFGIDLHDAFAALRDEVSKTYGEPRKSYDLLRTGSPWAQPKDWMMSLVEEERTLSTYWSAPLPGHVTGIMLGAKGITTSKGFLTLGYEFEGFRQYVNSKRAAGR